MAGTARTLTPWVPWEPMSPAKVAAIFGGCRTR
jgi:hypothetical protein